MALLRDIDTDTYNSLQTLFHPILLVELDWPDGAIYAHSNLGTISWNSNTWNGVGNLGNVSIPEDSTGMVSVDAEVSIKGYLETLFNYLGTDISGRLAKVYLGTTTEAGGNILTGDPFEIFSGYMDTRRFDQQDEEYGASHNLTIGLGSGPSARSKASINHSVEDSSIKTPGDTLFRHVIFIENQFSNPKTWPEP